MDALETIEYKGYEVKIYQDEFRDDSPRDWDNLGTMACFHRNYNLGDEHDFADPEELEEFLDEEKAIDLPLYLYDHSGLTMNTRGFSCPWDSGQVGIIYIERETLRREFGWKRITARRRKKVIEILRQEVETYDQYLTGDVYGYNVEDKDGDTLDSCWGFYGHDWDKNGLLDHAKPGIDHHAAKRLQERVQLVRRFIAATSAA